MLKILCSKLCLVLEIKNRAFVWKHVSVATEAIFTHFIKKPTDKI